MDYFWVMLLIFGAIVSLGQKSQKGKKADEVEDPDPNEEWERRLREILQQDQPTSQTEAPETTTPRTSPQQPQTISPQPRKVATQPRSSASQPRSVTPQPRTVSMQQNKSASTYYGSVQQAHTMAPPSQPKGALSTAEQGGDFDQMIDDFTIEKAVIYAEILKPKYKEY